MLPRPKTTPKHPASHPKPDTGPGRHSRQGAGAHPCTGAPESTSHARETEKGGINTPDNTEKLKWLYRHFAPQQDPDGFRLYSAAQEVTGIKHLWEEFPYEDACGRFELADGRQLLRYLTAAYFQAVSWEIVPGTTYERAILQEVDTSTPEYRAFEKQIYEAALRRMGLRKTRASKSERGEAR